MIDTYKSLEVKSVFQIPDGMVLVAEAELYQLEESSLLGKTWTMKDLEKRVQRQSKWIKENILEKPLFKKYLDVENGGCVFYPTPGTGEKWSFQAKGMADFLDQHFSEIYSR
ncbi:DUF771 domain-containing protein [Brochothrix campestris]|uniref:DUF771 domain-containing protein n=1 Tax=Brochothrix campestris FSL F6-1037 TaxID=1265861 RepID=W7CQN6_9LIST|nr:DUF771 domain-containing protein [Brochothrix campestris]EUJ41949.1 hypothetical protein BCAMP_01020 [Brochothrix campestris FSL F6-1037]